MIRIVAIIIAFFACVAAFLFMSNERAKAPDLHAEVAVNEAQSSQINDDGQIAGQVIQKLKEDANNYEGQFESERMVKAAQNYMQEQSQQLDGEEKRMFMLGAFVGFQYRHTVATYNYCAEQNVKIDNYVQVFRQRHQDLYDVLEKSPDKQIFIDTVLSDEVKAQARKLVDDEFEEVAPHMPNGVIGLCNALNNNAETVVDKVEFKKTLPDAYAFLVQQ